MDTNTPGTKYHVCEECVDENWMIPLEEEAHGFCACGKPATFLVQDTAEVYHETVV